MTDTIKACENMDKPYSFISYSHKDADIVYPILKELNLNGYRIWYDKHIEIGIEWADRISGWLKHDNCAKFIIFISQNSIASGYVKDEVNFARKYSKSCLVVYLEEISLEDGLELLLDRWQSIRLYDEKQEIFFQKLFLGIPSNTIEINTSSLVSDSNFIKKYAIEAVLGKGGTATVYKARNKATGALVTVKVANCSSEERNIKNNSLIIEKQALAKINGPSIPKIIDFGEDFIDGTQRYYLVESYVEGISLADIRCRLSDKEVASIILNVAKSLQYLHVGETYMVHNDIKPANIMIDQFNQTYLIDFGGCTEANCKTRWGTVTFAAPEQKDGRQVDVRTDIYSLGITMKYLLCKDYLQQIGMTFNKVNDRPLREIAKNVSPLLALIVDKMVDVNMTSRFQSLEELIFALQEFIDKTSGEIKMITLKNQYFSPTTTQLQHDLQLLFADEMTGISAGEEHSRFSKDKLKELQELFDDESNAMTPSAVLPISVAIYTRDITTRFGGESSANTSLISSVFTEVDGIE